MSAAKAWGLVLVLSLTWPFFLPGEAFALRDMMVLPGMELTRSSLGFGDAAARNVPQDALLGIVPFPVLTVRAVMVLSACGAAWAGWRSSRTAWGRAAAMTVAVWNPFVVERLLQGQWSLAAAAWLIPLAAASTAVGARWLMSLTPTGAIAGLLAAPSRMAAGVSAALCLPWVVAGAVSGSGAGTASAASAGAFAPRAEAWVGTLGALAGLGGIWNGAAVPPSRSLGFAVFGVALAAVLALGWCGVPRRLLLLAAVGFAVAVLSSCGALTWAVTSLPGGGLLRDGQKWLILCIPAFVAAAGALPARGAAAALALALLQVPDAPAAIHVLRPVEAPAFPEVDHRGRDVFFVDRPMLQLRADGAPVVDPVTKLMNTVEPLELVVDGVVVDQASPRWVAANALVDDPADAAALRNRGNLGALRDLGIGVVVYPDGRAVETGAPARGIGPLALVPFGVWLAVPVLTFTAKLTKRRRR
ncbi:hypothetical protein [Corynebacterium sp.]|uniref:hypothetical protein n=1 Tax=Corynebacterium sp. TaxID=1720 RepID=UPI002A912CAE|nr:hypothetical protein [Corynebacterium sp.]MDY5785618.1 hypothetical protein [Corynebacterium sp.]